MSLFSKPKMVLWPKSKSLEVYISTKENNHLTLDINLWKENSDKDLEPLVDYLKKNKIESASVLIPDNVVLTKSFIYDTKIDQIDKKEVIGLAESFVPFKIDPNFIEYKLVQEKDKTIIQSTILEKEKVSILTANLAKLNIKITATDSVSSAVSKVLSPIYSDQFFLIYPLNEHEYTLLLSKDNTVYLTNNFKGPTLDIQKTINYSNLYFSVPAKKVYYPEAKDIEIVTTSEIEKTAYNESQIAQTLNKPANLPLPVLGEFNAIIGKVRNNNSLKGRNMENKKNILPIIAVLIFTAALVSFIVYFIFSKNSSKDLDINSNVAPTSIEKVVTIAPTPTLVEIDKDIKIQVLNATDINGQAATLKSRLIALGFEDISVGNASKNVTKNGVEYKSAITGLSNYFEAQTDLEFPAVYSDELDEDSKYDVVFTIGTDLSEDDSEDMDMEKEEETTTPTPTEVEEE